MKSRKITLQSAMEKIIAKCQYCTMAMVDQNNHPYLLPMNFGYADAVVYLHSATQGKKVDILRNNNRVCLVFSTNRGDYKYNDPAITNVLVYKVVAEKMEGRAYGY